MALGNGFKTNGSNAAPRSKWGGVKSAMPRTPILDNFGHEYDLELVSYEETRNPSKGTESYKVTVRVIDSDDQTFKNGGEAVVIYSKHGKSLEAGMSKLKATSVAFAGFSNDDEYDAVDPDGEFISNTFSQTGENLLGERAHVKVLRGQEKEKEPGKYWPEYEWTPLPRA